MQFNRISDSIEIRGVYKLVSLLLFCLFSIDAAEYIPGPEGTLVWYDLILEGALEDNRNGRMMVQRVDDSITLAVFRDCGTPTPELTHGPWEVFGTPLKAEGSRVHGTIKVWEDQIAYPMDIDFTVSGKAINGTYVLVRSKGVSLKTKTYADGEDYTGSVTGSVRTESEVKRANSIRGEALWNSWLGAYQCFSAIDFGDVQIVDRLDEAQLIWRSEFVPSTEHGSCRYGVTLNEAPAGGGASPLLHDGRIYQFYSRPAGDSWLGCYHTKLFTDGHGNWTADTLLKTTQKIGYSVSDLLKIYAASADEYGMCIDAATGRTLWRVKFPDEGYTLNQHKGALTNNTGCIGDGNWYIFGALGIVRAVDLGTGQVKWTQNLPRYYETMMRNKQKALDEGKMEGGGRGNCNFINYIGGVVVGPTELGESGISGLDAETGEILWTVEDRVMGGKSGALKWTHQGNEYIVTANGAGEIYCFDPKDGSRKWMQTGAADNSFQAVLDGDYLVVANTATDGTDRKTHTTFGNMACYKLALEGAALHWELQGDLGCPGNSAAAVIYNGHAYMRPPDRLLVVELGSGDIKANVTFSDANWQEQHSFTMEGRYFPHPETQHKKSYLDMYEADPEQFVQMGDTWWPPHFNTTTYQTPLSNPAGDGRLFMRGHDGIYCYDLRKPGTVSIAPRSKSFAATKEIPIQSITLLKREIGITVGFGLHRGARVSLALYDCSGRCRGIIYNGKAEAGMHRIPITGCRGAGLYIVRGTVGGHTVSRKVTLQ